jgi:hypothetical protein
VRLSRRVVLLSFQLAEMIGMSLRGHNQMIYPLTYVFLACMLFCIFSQLHFLALGLSFFDALYVVPVFQCFFISVSTLGGAAYFGEFARFELLQIIFFPIGITSTLTGVYILSSREMKKGITRQPGEVSVSVIVNGSEMVAGSTNGADMPLSERGSQSEMPSAEVIGIQLADRNGAQISARMPIVSPVLEGDELEVGTAEDNFVKPLAGAGLRSDDDEVMDAHMNGTAGKYFVPPLPIPVHPSNGRHSLPILVASSMPQQDGMYIDTNSPIVSSRETSTSVDRNRPNTAGHHDRRMSRFAQRRSLVGPQNFTAFTHGHAATTVHSRRPSGNFGTLDSTATATAASSHQRKRSTWTNESGQFNLGSVFHAGLATLGVTAPPAAE